MTKEEEKNEITMIKRPEAKKQNCVMEKEGKRDVRNQERKVEKHLWNKRKHFQDGEKI